MNSDLERQLAEMGGGAAALAARLRSAPCMDTAPGFAARTLAAAKAAERRARRTRFFWQAAAAAALAGLFVCHALVVAPAPSGPKPEKALASSPAAAYLSAVAVYCAACNAAGPASESLAAGVETLLGSQAADGGWANARLSAWNAAALAKAAEAGLEPARTAFARARRFLQANGIAEIPAADFPRMAEEALANSPVQDAAVSAALAAIRKQG